MSEEAKHPGGRPLKFASVEEMQAKIDAYFDECDAHSDYYTITGLALALDTTRRTLLDYQEKDGFSHAVTKAKLRVENDYEKALRRTGRSGDIFGLKNFGWRDTQDVNLGGQKDNPVKADLTLSPADAYRRMVDGGS